MVKYLNTPESVREERQGTTSHVGNAQCKGMLPATRDLLSKDVPIFIVKLWHVFEIGRILRNKSSFPEQLELFSHIILPRKFINVGQKLLFRQANQRILDLASRVLRHRNDTLFANRIMVGLRFLAIVGLRCFLCCIDNLAAKLSISAFVTINIDHEQRTLGRMEPSPARWLPY